MSDAPPMNVLPATSAPPPGPPRRGWRMPPWRILADWALILIAIGAILWLIRASWSSLTWFLIGLVIFYLLLPLVNWLSRYLPRSVAAALGVLIVLGVVIGLILFAVPVIAQQLVQLYANLPSYDDLRVNFARLVTWYETNVPSTIRGIADQALERLRTQLNANLQSIITNTAAWLAGVAGQIVSFIFFIFGFVVIPFWLYMLWSIKYDGIRLVNRMVSPRWRDDVWNMVRLFDQTVSGYLRGQLLLGATVGALVAIGLLVLRLFGFETRYILLLAIFAGITELIPYIGPILGAIPGVLLALFSPDPLWTTVAVVAVYLIVQQLENSLLVPKITGDAVNIHPAILTVLLIMFGSVFGLLGAILAAPVSALARDWFLYIHRRLRGGTPREVWHSLQVVPPARKRTTTARVAKRRAPPA
jgi:predicted PurR-regulated permease PerM